MQNQSQNIFSFGMLMPGRSYTPTGGDCRIGFNGKENDNEVKGEGNQQDYGMRIYDPRLGKFLSVDPITAKYPELSPYQFASNRPIDGVDQDGKEWEGIWAIDIWLDWKFNDNTGIKLLESGLEKKITIQTNQISYQNINVTTNVQRNLSQINTIQANTKMTAGIGKVTAWTIKISADIALTFAPIGEALQVIERTVELICAGVKIESVSQGSNGKIAIIG